jgi:hypothetical protein
MKKAILIITVLVLFSTSIGAETILLCIGTDAPELDRKDWPVMVSRAFEDGAMDVFFEGGHIVTNAVFADDESSSGPGLEKAGDLAYANGADAVLMINVYFPQNSMENLPVPEKVGYALFDYTGREMLPYGEYLLNAQVGTGIDELLDEFVAAAGIIAEQASSHLGSF